MKSKRVKKAAGIFFLTDIVMNLFIFFFIAFNLIAAFKTDKESNIRDVSIPRTTDHQPTIIKPARVIIQGNRTVLLEVIPPNGNTPIPTPVTPVELTEKVRFTLNQKNNDIMPDGFEEQPNQEVPSVIITADEEVEYNYVMQVLNAVKNSGLSKIGLSAKTEEI